MKYCQSDILSCIRRYAFKCVDFLINHPLPLPYLGVFLEKPANKKLKYKTRTLIF